jgi:hypothetical protein
LANISNVFSHDGGFPSDRHSINFQLQVCWLHVCWYYRRTSQVS